MAENFDLVFGSSASQSYSWNDSDYQNGWQTVGDTPPTREQFDALQRRADLKAQDLNNRLAPIEENDTHDYRQPSATYAVGNIAYHATLPTGWYLECTAAGETGSGELTITSPTVGGAVSDGAVTWTIRKTASTNDITNLSVATQTTNGLMSATDKTKLDGIEANANNYSLPSATASVRGGVTIGSNISLSGDTISVSNSNVQNALGFNPAPRDAATQSAAGLMSAADKKKLDGIASNANNYSLPAATGSVRGGVKVGSNISLSGDTISLAKANVTNALGYTPPTTNTTYSTGTASYSGITKLYTGLGNNTDGTMTQKAIKDSIGTGYITEASYNASTGAWYRKYSDGWIEQGGITDGALGTVVCNLLKPMLNDKYLCFVESCKPNFNSQAGYTFNIPNKSTTTVTIYNYDGSIGAKPFNWMVCGMGA
jgi:hypothetical protein